MENTGKIINALLFGVLLFLFTFASIRLALAQQSWEKEWKETLAAAKKEGKVVVATNPSTEMRLSIGSRFKARFGIPVEFIAGRTSQTAARLRTERRARVYTVDVAIGGAGTMSRTLYPEKMIDPLKPVLILPEVVDPSKWKTGGLWFIDPEKRFCLRLLYYVGSAIFVNTDYVKIEEFKSIKELLNPKWRGKISVRDPTAGGGGAGDAAVLYTQFGEEFVKGVYIDQKPRISRDDRQLADWLARGSYPISIGADTGEVELLGKEGLPVATIYRLPDMKPVTKSSLGVLALMNRAPHPNAAKVFVNWIASKEGLEIFGRTAAYPTTRNDIDELSYAAPELIPIPGVEYFDTGGWGFTATREKVRLRMKELLKR